MPVDRQIAQKLLNLWFRPVQILAPTHPVEMDIAPNPVTVAALGADGIMLQAHHFPHLIQQFQFGVGDDEIRAHAVSTLPTVCSPGLTALIGLHKLLKYANGFHPVALAGGPVLTWDRPKDHPWHRALWFSWKFINGVNYWEPNAQSGTLDGRTEWSNLQSELRPDFSARLSMEITYRPADGSPVLKERRVIAISAPAQDGSYSMDWQMTFTALDKAVVFERTPPPGEPEGKPWGGCSGLAVPSGLRPYGAGSWS